MDKRIPIILGFLWILLAIYLQVTHVAPINHWIDRLENVAYDLELQASLVAKTEPLQSNVVIVDIDDKSIAKEGRWPWPRTKLATLTEELKNAGAVVIAFDMLFPEIEENIVSTISKDLIHKKLLTPEVQTVLNKITPYFASDTIFANTLAEVDTLIGIGLLPTSHTEGVIPAPVLTLTPNMAQLNFITAKGMIGINPALAAKITSSGFVNAFNDEDGIIRRIPLLVRFQDKIYPSLALEAVRLYLLSNITLYTPSYGKYNRLEGIFLGKKLIPTDDQSQVIIPFQGGSYTFPYYSATDILQKKIKEPVFEGKIVFVGTTATGLGDLKAASVGSNFPGVEIHATVANGILKNNFPVRPSWALGAEIVITVIIGLSFLLIFPLLSFFPLILLTVFVPILLIFANNWLHAKTGIVLSIFIPLMLIILLAITNIIYGYFFETRQRLRLKNIFGQYVPEKHIEAMLKTSGNYGLLGEDREMTVLFADIRRFTSIAEYMSAAQLKEMLNEFFTAMTQIIFQNQGTIDKYIGDLIMAFWGAPLTDENHAEHAIQSALDMQEELLKLQPYLSDHHWPLFKIGISINSGIMSVGDMGSKFRKNYTILGDAVNLGARLESLTKFYDVKIIASEYTKKDQDKFIFRLLDRVRVPGKKKSVAIYEVIGQKDKVTNFAELDTHHQALGFYFQQQWQAAQNLFQKLAVNYPQTKIYQIFLKRIAQFQQNPPHKNWDGVFRHKGK